MVVELGKKVPQSWGNLFLMKSTVQRSGKGCNLDSQSAKSETSQEAGQQSIMFIGDHPSL